MPKKPLFINTATPNHHFLDFFTKTQYVLSLKIDF